MAKEDLIPVNKRTKGEAKKISQKGGIASGVARRAKKAMRDMLKEILELPASEAIKANPAMKAVLGGKADVTNADAVLVGQVLAAVKGNTNAAAFIRDTIGEKPKDTVDIDIALPKVISGADELK